MTNPSRKTILLATDQQQSVLNAHATNQAHPLAYSPYGHRPWDNGFLSLLGFNGELPDRFTGHYHLGKGYRQFNPVLMRFNSPDSWSPFGEGGINAYAYCSGDPINRVDPTGHSFWALLPFVRPSKSLAKVPTISKKTIDTAARIANMQQGMLYKKQTLGYQLGDKASRLDLNGKSVEKINKYTNIIKENNDILKDKTKQSLDQMPDSQEKATAVKNFRDHFIQFPTVINPTSHKDRAVVELHSQAMYFQTQKNHIEHLQKIQRRQRPAIANSSIRQLT
jgi:RHS repeat-associated protein